MPIFHESGITYPVPAEVKVIIRYYDVNDAVHHVSMFSNWPTIPLITFSRAAKVQIAYKGRNYLVLDAGDFCGGMQIYEDIMSWLVAAWRYDDPSGSFPPLQVPFARSFKDDPWTCLNFYRALLAFDLVSRAQQTWISDAMWHASNCNTLPHPQWVHAIWVELTCCDKDYVDRTIQAAARTWKVGKLDASELDALKQIEELHPELWELLDRAMDIEHWHGYADWLVNGPDEEVEDDDGIEVSSTDAQASDDDDYVVVAGTSVTTIEERTDDAIVGNVITKSVKD